MADDMTMDRFDDLAMRFGGRIEDWPVEEREAARRFLISSREARARLEDAELLDLAFADLRAETETPPDAQLMERVLADAAGRRPSRIVATVAGGASEAWNPLRGLIEALGGWRPATAVAASAAIGLMIGLSAPAAVATEFGFAFEIEEADLEGLDAGWTLEDGASDLSDIWI